MPKLPDLITLLIGGCIAGLASPAAANSWTAVPSDSKLEFVGVYMEEDFRGRFERFVPSIEFDPQDLASARFEVAIDLASARTSDEEWDEYLIGEDFFAAEQNPQARFVADRFEPTEDGYLARGTLELRGVQQPVALRFKFDVEGEQATLDGEATLDRIAFGVGTGDWADPEMIGHSVRVQTQLKLRR
jgi:polyisoprenoid-binding protein YceI